MTGRTIGPARTALAVMLALVLAGPAAARDSLGMFESWGAFRDPGVPRCYAIALSEPGRGDGKAARGYADVGTWPRRNLRGKVHFRLSRPPLPREAPRLVLGGHRYTLALGGSDAWPQTPADEAAILAGMRSAATMTISARDRANRLFTDSYRLAGAASAMDSALVGCAPSR